MPGVVGAALLGLVIACALWWAYFDVVAIVSERHFREARGERLLLMARDSYSYLHLPMIAGIVLVALGVKKAIGHVDEPLKTIPAVALFGGIALYYAGHLGFRLRNVGTLNRPRLVALVACLCLIPVAREVDAIVALALAAGVTSAVIAFETIRYAEARRSGAPGSTRRRPLRRAARRRRGARLRRTTRRAGRRPAAGRRRPARDRGGSRAGSRARDHVAERPRVLVGARGEQGVEHVADGADARRERDLVALEALRVAAAVPALVVAERNLLGQLHERGARAGQDARADRGVGLHRRPLGRVELARLQQDVVGDADLADVVQRAGVAQQLGLLGVMPDLAREPLAEPAHALDVHAGLGVAPLHGHAEPVGDLALRLGEVGRALAHALLEQLVVARHAVRTRRSANSLQAIAPNAPISRATSGAATSMIVPLSKSELGACEEAGTGEDRHRAHDPEREAPARERSQHREQGEQHDVHADRPSAAGGRASAVQIAFAWTSAPGISSSPPTGVECTSRSVGAVAPTTTIRPRIMRPARGRRRRPRRRPSGSCRAGRGSRSMPCRRGSRPGRAGRR